MTFKEFGYIADAIKTYFPRDNVLPTEHAMSLWYEGLKDLPYQIVSIALKKYVQTNKFSPTIADIREQAEQLNQNNQKTDLNENEAWTLVLKAIQRSGYYSEEEFAKLPKIIQRTIGSSSSSSLPSLIRHQNPTQLPFWFAKVIRLWRYLPSCGRGRAVRATSIFLMSLDIWLECAPL